MSSNVLIAPNILQTDINSYEVNSFNPKKPNEYYRVTLTEFVNNMPILGSCTCPHFEYRKVQCKHIQTIISELVTVENEPQEEYELAKCDYCNQEFEANMMSYKSEYDTGYSYYVCQPCSLRGCI